MKSSDNKIMMITNRNVINRIGSQCFLLSICIAAILLLTCSDKKKALEDPLAKMELFILENRSRINNSVIRIGGQIDLAPGWHTYWLNPGDAGLAPRIEPVSKGIRLDNLRLSIPHKIMEESIATIGYKKSMFFSVDALVTDSSNSDITLKSVLLVCNNMCIAVQCTASINIHSSKFDTLSETIKTISNDTFLFPQHDTLLEVAYHTTKTTIDFSFFRSDSAVTPKIDALFPLTEGILDLVAKPRSELRGTTLFVSIKRAQTPIEIPDSIVGLLLFNKGHHKGVWFNAVNDTK